MPYDGTTYTHAPYTLESLAAWLEKQPADGEYDPGSASSCLICEYGKAHGSGPDVGGAWFVNAMQPWNTKGFGSPVRCIAYDGWWGEHTFGAALARTRKALAER